jgi:hypothetical protein
MGQLKCFQLSIVYREGAGASGGAGRSPA